MTKRAPARHTAHYVPPRKGDSFRGLEDAHADGYRWIDCNWLISRDGVVFAQHGSPYGLGAQGYLPKRDKRKVRDLDAVELRELKTPDGYVLRSSFGMFKHAAKVGINIEFEAKDDHRFTNPLLWRRLRVDARAAWGPDWQHHVQVKVLTNLSGGLKYALAVCEAANAAGFTTIVLPRGVRRLQRINGPAITYVRGGRC